MFNWLKEHKWQSFIGIFIGYAAYYLVRKNFSLAKPFLLEEGYTVLELGTAASALPIAYGLSKFLMGIISDKSNPKYFMSIGLFISASITLLFGYSNFAISSISIMAILLFINGWVQGMGWPACGKIMVYFFNKEERGGMMSIWNIAHNIGAGLLGIIATWSIIYFDDWKSLFYTNAYVAYICTIAILLLVKNVPKQEGEIKEKSNALVWKYILSNRVLWLLAISNAFVYLIRYGVMDWAPTYLMKEKQFDISEAGIAFSLFELAAIPGTILCGFASDKFFKGKRSIVSIICLIIVIISLLIYWLNPAGNYSIDIIALFGIGFAIYGPVMLIGVQALDAVPKETAGASAGFTGLFGYLGGALSAELLLGLVVQYYGWNSGFILLLGAAIISIVLLKILSKNE